MATLRELIIKISANSQSFQSEISRASRMGNDYYRSMQNGGRQAAASSRETQRALSGVTSQLAETKSMAMGLAGSFAGAFATRNLIQLADSYNSISARLKLATADTTDLATKIAGASSTSPVTINVSASDSNGDKTTSPVAIQVYPTDGVFQFHSVTDFEFGSLPVPTQETLFAPTTAPSIILDDTQTVGKGWSVSAQATAMTNGSNTLHGKIVYVNAGGKLVDMTKQAATVGTGERQKDANTAEVANGWAGGSKVVPASQFSSGAATGVTPGIYLDAQPNIYASAAAYTGSIDWELTNAPS